MKRGRGVATRSVERTASEEADCPICFEKLHARTQVNFFQCNHIICRSCDRRMRNTSDNRCPVCRCPRRGMTVSECEPSPNRNRESEDIILPPSTLLPQEFTESLHELASGAISFASGFYGNRSRSRASTYIRVATRVNRAPPRPDTGHVMFFRIEEPDQTDQTDLSNPVASAGRLSESQASTFADILGIQSEALQALLNVPEISIHDWLRMRETQQGTTPRRQ